MSLNTTTTTTDVVEEDAADLQFPKDMFEGNWTNTNVNKYITSDNLNDNATPRCTDLNFTLSADQNVAYLSNYSDSEKCSICKSILSVPFIRCTECIKVDICTNCFTNGAENDSHKNNHGYRVISENFCVFENTDWSASEEKVLLDSIIEFGYGNWTAVSNRLQYRTPAECKYHYETFYIDEIGSDLLPKISETETSLFGEAPIPYNLRTYGVEDPPRHNCSSPTFEIMAGYNAARSDFDFPFNSSAESLIGDLHDDVYDKSVHESEEKRDPLIEDLQCAVLRAYNNRLKERQRRMWVIKEHGLILPHKQMSSINRYQVLLPFHIVENFQAYMQLLSGIEFDFTMESLCRTVELRRYLLRLQELRSKGVRTFYGANLYKRLSTKRERDLKDLHAFINRPDLTYNVNRFENEKINLIVSNIPNKRSIAPPLDIVGLPGYNRLTDEEKALCSGVRLVPESYLEFKNILVSEANKLGGSLRLQDARKLIRIDVNKTRKLYDFLIECGHISRPKQSKRFGVSSNEEQFDDIEFEESKL